MCYLLCVNNNISSDPVRLRHIVRGSLPIGSVFCSHQQHHRTEVRCQQVCHTIQEGYAQQGCYYWFVDDADDAVGVNIVAVVDVVCVVFRALLNCLLVSIKINVVNK